MALFDEKYGDKVRVVDMGVSKEFCAGTHVSNTSEVIDYEVNYVESIGSGIFRILATTGKNAKELLKNNLNNLFDTINTLNNKALTIVKNAKTEGIDLTYNPIDLNTNLKGYRYVLFIKKALEDTKNNVHELEVSYQNKKSQSALKQLDVYKSQIENNCIIAECDVQDSNIIKDMANALVNNFKLDLVLLASKSDSKVTFVCATNGKFNAGQIVKEAATICGGNGGGKPTLAQAGGKDPSHVTDALNKVRELVK